MFYYIIIFRKIYQKGKKILILTSHHITLKKFISVHTELRK